jgi:hypothetical protein
VWGGLDRRERNKVRRDAEKAGQARAA